MVFILFVMLIQILYAGATQRRVMNSAALNFDELLLKIILWEDSGKYEFVYEEPSKTTDNIMLSHYLMLHHLMQNIELCISLEVHPLFLKILQDINSFSSDMLLKNQEIQVLRRSYIMYRYNLHEVLNLVDNIVKLSDDQKLELIKATQNFIVTKFHNIGDVEDEIIVKTMEPEDIFDCLRMEYFIKNFNNMDNNKKSQLKPIFINFRFFECILKHLPDVSLIEKSDATNEIRRLILKIHVDWLTMETRPNRFYKKMLTRIRDFFVKNGYRSVYMSSYDKNIIYSKAYSFFYYIWRLPEVVSKEAALFLLDIHRKTTKEFTDALTLSLYEPQQKRKAHENIQKIHYISIYRYF